MKILVFGQTQIDLVSESGAYSKSAKTCNDFLLFHHLRNDKLLIKKQAGRRPI